MYEAEEETPTVAAMKARAVDSANHAIHEAFNSLDIDPLSTHQKQVSAFSELVAAHAIIQVIDRTAATLANPLQCLLASVERVEQSLGEMAESLDFLAAGEAGEIAAESVLSDHEKQVIYRALESDYINSGTALSIEEMDAVLARFKRIAGL